jgi:N-acetylmuramoyl-L-alanine amidase
VRIVIVRGHGGRDSGAGPTGLTEAEVTKAVAERLGGMGYEVKGQPGGVPSVVARGILNTALRVNRPDAVVALHCNAPSTTLHRCDVYYNREDAARLRESQRLADIIARRAVGHFAETSVVVSFPILRDGKPFTPGAMKGTAKTAIVLVEMGFLSCPEVEYAFRLESWRDRAAETIDAAIREWAL